MGQGRCYFVLRCCPLLGEERYSLRRLVEGSLSSSELLVLKELWDDLDLTRDFRTLLESSSLGKNAVA